MLLIPKKFIKKAGSALKYAIRHLYIVFFFATIYYIVTNYVDDNSLREPLSPLDCFYFSLATQTTVGYGDISGSSSLGMKIATILQLVTLYAVFVVEIF
jgi:hypothetical protein